MAKIVAAVGTATSAKNKDLSKRIEFAMAQAVKDAQAMGISLSETDKIRALMKTAREKVLRQYGK